MMALNTKVYEKFRSVDAHLDPIERTWITKADLAELKTDLITWIVGTTLGAGAVAISVMTVVLNHVARKPLPPAPQYTPIYISVPQTQQHGK